MGTLRGGLELRFECYFKPERVWRRQENEKAIRNRGEICDFSLIKSSFSFLFLFFWYRRQSWKLRFLLINVIFFLSLQKSSMSFSGLLWLSTFSLGSKLSWLRGRFMVTYSVFLWTYWREWGPVYIFPTLQVRKLNPRQCKCYYQWIFHRITEWCQVNNMSILLSRVTWHISSYLV